MRSFKRYSLLLFILWFMSLDLFCQVNVITYNIRLNIPVDGENAWPFRKDNVISLLKFHDADIFCLQEVLHDQLLDVIAAFPDFKYVGAGRDDGAQKGEYSPVFYNAEKYRLLDSGWFWLSEDPGRPGKGWDAAYNRICTWAKLKEKKSKKDIFVFCTHFDNVGEEARKHSAELIIKRISETAGINPVILCGDFNLPPDSEPIQKLASFMQDSYTIAEMPPYGARGTWSGFTYEDEPGERIDYIFVTPGIRILKYAVLTDAKDRKFFSDHLPVFVRLEY